MEQGSEQIRLVLKATLGLLALRTERRGEGRSRSPVRRLLVLPPSLKRSGSDPGDRWKVKVVYFWIYFAV